jgi:hypothetical protein
MGPAPLPTCGLNPASVTPGANSATSTLTITAPSALANLQPAIGERFKFLTAGWPAFSGFIFIGIGLLSSRQWNRSRNRWLLAGSLCTILAVMAGCGTTPPPPPQAQNYTITVTGVSGSIQHTTQVAVTVQ